MKKIILVILFVFLVLPLFESTLYMTDSVDIIKMTNRNEYFAKEMLKFNLPRNREIIAKLNKYFIFIGKYSDKLKSYLP